MNVHIESLTQLHLVAALGWELGLRPNVTIRVNPDFQITHAGMRMGGERLSSASTPNRFRHYCKNWAHVTWHWRVSCLLGFAVPAPSYHCRSTAAMCRLVMQLASDLPLPPRYVNLGGGFGIPYFEGEVPLDLDAVAQPMHAWLSRMQRALPGVRPCSNLALLVGEAGAYVCRVIDRKFHAAPPSLLPTVACTTTSRPRATSVRYCAAISQ